MRIQCFGTTGFHPSPSRHTACYYLPECNLLLDAGTGLFRLTAALLTEPKQSLDILLSHAHLDHIVGLTFLIDTMAVTELEKVRVFGNADMLEAIREHLFTERLFPVEPRFEMIPLEGSHGELELGATTIRYFPLEHPGGSTGYTILAESGKKIAYVTDTVPYPHVDYMQHIMEADLLLHECYFEDEYAEWALKTGHSWLSPVAEVAKASRAKRTGLIHINPLAEVLGKSLTLSDEQIANGMFVAEDEMILEV